MEAFERFLAAHLPHTPSFHPHYERALAEMVEVGGKRFRPRLLLSVVEALQPALVEGGYYAAAALEVLHTYSLIHDDLPAMDNADMRRGHPTLHKSYDEVTAILAGDALNTYAFELLAAAPLSAQTRIALVAELAAAGGAGGMVLGQAIDCHFTRARLTYDELVFLHRHKTGVLIAAALVMGGVIVQASSELLAALRHVGMEAGLLFQIRDDLIDALYDEEEAGKTIGQDEEKNSFVTLLGVEGATEAYEAQCRLVKEALGTLPDRLREAVALQIEPYMHLR